MKKYLLFVPLILLVGALIWFTRKEGIVSGVCSSRDGERTTIVMKNDRYEPQDIRIVRCTKVVFKNEAKEVRWPASNIHPTHGIYPEFDPQQGIEPGNEWSFVFDKVGNWKYHDHLVPSIRGLVKVEN